MSEPSLGRINQKSQTFTCPSCGGRMIFDPESQQLKCPYCDRLKPFHVEKRTPSEYDIRYAPPVSDSAWGDETHTVRCNGCGAEIILTGETTADMCPFCGAPHVLADHETYRGPGFPQVAEQKAVRPFQGEKDGRPGPDHRSVPAPLDL